MYLAGYVGYFIIFTEMLPFKGDCQCFHVDYDISKASGTTDDDYACFGCNCKGSFLRLQKQKRSLLLLHHLRVKGTLLKASGMKFKKKCFVKFFKFNIV